MVSLRLAVVLLAAVLQPAVAAPLAIHLAGDSTMAEKSADRRPETGWGEALPAYLDPAQARVVNHAADGRSTRTFVEEGRWQALLDALQPGDAVFIQFGHNDASSRADRHTPPEAYAANLRRFVAEVRARQALPVLFTPAARRHFVDGRLVDTHGAYPGLVREVAAELDVPLVDMQRESAELLADLGEVASRRLFLWVPAGHPNHPDGVQDDTHFSPEGAQQMAGLAVDGLRELGILLGALRPL
ncbi:rhamnogalacturonan acetylesterase [Coralloluteibacterium thermophilus]|uniref:Rhamnogalacturonan acetylesterase n=1 Tax=Coralloluteibacterium thermophilum TaxID=2707049 RepID=A0ABV9NI58_9GAMM